MSLQERTVTLNIGDWSDDGHGKCTPVTVKLFGEDLSNESLNAGFRASNAEFGINLLNEFEDYEDNRFSSSEVFQKILDAGFPNELDYARTPAGSVKIEGSPYQYDNLDAVGLFVWWCGREIPGFSWEIVENNDDLLIGGHKTILSGSGIDGSFYGYGLY